MGLGLQPAIARATFRLNSVAVRLLPQRSHLVVLAYHRVGNREQLFPGPMELAECTVEQFEDQMTWVRRHCTPVDLATAQRVIFGQQRCPNRAVLVTFDDGYREDLLRVRPCLERLGIRATVFLPTDYIGTRRRFWWDRIGACVQLTRHSSVSIDLETPAELPLTGTAERDAATSRLLALAKPLVAERRDRLIAELEQRLEVGDTREADRALVLSWDEVRQLAAVFDFGAHTESHPVLSTLGAEEARREMGRSKEIVEEQLGIPCPAIAIPYGGPDEYTRETVELAAELGFSVIFSLEVTVRRPERVGQLALVDRVEVGAEGGLPVLALKLTWPRTFIPSWTDVARQRLDRWLAR
jgi:peptidoglycan/xylan/chitin deacetylase (PgdA/CDA1 family)